MSSSLYAVWMLCALGSAVFAAAAAIRVRGISMAWRASATAGATFAIATTWTAVGAPRPEQVGLAAAIGAGMHLARPTSVVPCALAGTMAGAWGALAAAQGLSWFLAVPAGLTIPMSAAALARRRPGFAPPQIHDEALLVIAVCGLGLAMLPGVVEGWHAAVNLNLGSRDVVARAAPVWTLAVVVAAAASGGVYALWSRR
jgi:hypothetical protein